MEKRMFLNASPRLFAIAKELRLKQTKAEMILWDYLKKKPLGFKFRRQHPISNYVADFFCFKLKIVIEVDGEIHENEESKRNDKLRTDSFNVTGIEVLRFKNDEVIHNIKWVEQQIERFILERHPL